MRKFFLRLAIALCWLLLALGAILFGVTLWIHRTFGAISIDQMLLNLPGAGGAEVTGAETGYIGTFIREAVLLPLGITALAIALFFIIRKAWRRTRTLADQESRDAARKQSGRQWSNASIALAAVAVFSIGAISFGKTVSLPQYLHSLTSTLSMADYYVSPDTSARISTAHVSDGEETPPNLVLIFLESIEDELANTDLFELDMLAPVTEVTQDWQSIPDYQVYSGGGWTMAGVVGTSCGVPLRGAGTGENDINSNEIGAESDVYLPGAVCLGDVLKAEGYQNVFLGGANAQFASKAHFLANHGYQTVKDLSTWEELGEEEVSDWGLSDRMLFEHAKSEITQLHDSGDPFNLTMLTLDSHEPAHLFDYCEQTTEDVLESVNRCSMELVADFIHFMSDNGYLEDTVVVLTGDHPKMVGGAFSSMGQLGDLENRPIFNRIWSPEGELPALRAGADQLSMYPTILDLMGYGAQNQRAGIGVSALLDSAPQSTLDLSAEEYQELIQSRSKDLYDMLWDPRTSLAAGT